MTARGQLLEPLALATEAVWYFAVASVLVAWMVEGPGPSLWVLIAAAGGSFYLARLLGLLELSPRSMGATGAVASIVGLYAILRLEYLGDLRLWELSWLGEFASHPGNAQGPLVMGSLLTVGLALRWALQGQSTITFDSVIRSFSAGFAAIVLAAVIDIGGDLDSAVGTAALPFFALGLIAIAAFHLERTAPEASAPINRPWALTLLTTVGLLMALALLATLVVLGVLLALGWLVEGLNPGPTLASVGQGLAWLWRGIVDLLILALMPLALAFEWVFQGLLGLLGVNYPELEPPEPAQPAEGFEEEQGEGGNLPAWLRVAGWVAAGTVLTVLVGALALVIFARLRPQRDERSGWRESVWHEGSLKNDLRGLLGRLLSSRRQRSPPAPDLPPDVMAVRRLYLSVLSRAADRGLERPPARTPLEFASPLAEHFGSQIPSEVSLAFARARYGLKPPPLDELRRLRNEWNEAGK
ncbi:MAG: DUF4129 domain-containing protein [Dehalococcoidia bacterium]